MKKALTVAGSDPTGGAGLQADIKVFHAFGIYGLSVPTALTVQNTWGVDSVHPVPEDLIAGQLDHLLADLRPDSLKTGMVYTAGAVSVIERAVRDYGLKNLVVDPVAVSSSGAPLSEEGVLDALRERLFPLSRCVTPNIYEASVLTGLNIEGVEDMEDAARIILGLGPDTVVVTGGHLEGTVVDVFYDGREFRRFEGSRAEGEYHGTGCAFSAAVAASLALGDDPKTSVGKAVSFVRNAIERAYRPGKGLGLLGF